MNTLTDKGVFIWSSSQDRHAMMRVAYRAEPDKGDPEGMAEVVYWQCWDHGPACWLTIATRQLAGENNYGRTLPPDFVARLPTR